MTLNLMTIRALATGLFSFIVAAILTAFISANVRELARHRGWDTFLIRWWDALPARWRASFGWQRLRGLWWFWWLFGFGGGAILALWLAPILVPASPKIVEKTATRHPELTGQGNNIETPISHPLDGHIFSTASDLKQEIVCNDVSFREGSSDFLYWREPNLGSRDTMGSQPLIDIASMVFSEGGHDPSNNNYITVNWIDATGRHRKVFTAAGYQFRCRNTGLPSGFDFYSLWEIDHIIFEAR